MIVIQRIEGTTGGVTFTSIKPKGILGWIAMKILRIPAPLIVKPTKTPNIPIDFVPSKATTPPWKRDKMYKQMTRPRNNR